ncbi:MAG: hypothetical protein R2788_15410 [Saprospiraceae bacterium]
MLCILSHCLVLLNEPLYSSIKAILQAHLLWDSEMEEMEQAAQLITLDIF